MREQRVSRKCSIRCVQMFLAFEESRFWRRCWNRCCRKNGDLKTITTFQQRFRQITAKIYIDLVLHLLLGGKEKEWTDCVQSDIRAFGITGDWETMAVKAEVWVEAVTKGGRRFMAAWRQEEEDAARHRQEKREATRLGKLQSHTEA